MIVAIRASAGGAPTRYARVAIQLVHDQTRELDDPDLLSNLLRHLPPNDRCLDSVELVPQVRVSRHQGACEPIVQFFVIVIRIEVDEVSQRARSVVVLLGHLASFRTMPAEASMPGLTTMLMRTNYSRPCWSRKSYKSLSVPFRRGSATSCT